MGIFLVRYSLRFCFVAFAFDLGSETVVLILLRTSVLDSSFHVKERTAMSRDQMSDDPVYLYFLAKSSIVKRNENPKKVRPTF